MRSDPYCSNCGYSLSGATESSKCPECGKPLVEVLTRDVSGAVQGLRRRSQQLLFGLPLIDVAFGPHGTERYGHARGVLAIGDRATGIFAFGGRAAGLVACGGAVVGVVAFGGFAAGIVGIGGFAIGLAIALGGFSIGSVAIGGFASGLLAFGGFASGYSASGGMSFGWYAEGGQAMGRYVLSGLRRDPEAVAFFNSTGGLKRVFLGMFSSLPGMLLMSLGIVVLSLAQTGMMLWARRWAQRKGAEERPAV